MFGLGNRYSQHSFASIPNVNIPRSKFDRSFTAKDTQQFDYLNPIYIDEVIPGDTHTVNLNAFLRLATPIVPIMDNMYYDVFFFFVPNRLTWENWEKFCGSQTNPGDSTDFTVPILTPAAAFTVGSIFDKFGLPTGVANVAVNNVLPLRAYTQIWDQWFRDQNMQNSLGVGIDDGPDPQGNYALQKRGKRHDYFTSCLPWPQKGNAVTLSLGTSADVWGSVGSLPTSLTGNHASPVMAAYVNSASPAAMKFHPSLYQNPDLTGASPGPANTSTTFTQSGATPASTSVAGFMNGSTTGGGDITVSTYSEGQSVYLNKSLSQAFDASATAPFKADLTTSTAVTVNALRLAIMTQSLLELDARGGTRYVEVLRAHYGVVSPDFRLQRPEYLGGGSIRIAMHPVAQTSPTSGSNAQGQLAAFATGMASGQQVGFSKSFVEHGYIIGLGCARGDITYQQGLNKMWSRQTRFDFFWPKLQELGEQAVLNQEIYAQGTSDDTGVFGYQERYAEYRYKPSEIRGQFRSTYSTPLDMWHLAEKFTALPTLSSSFIPQNTPMARIEAVTNYPHLLCDFFFQVNSARPMMMYGVPATLGRF